MEEQNATKLYDAVTLIAIQRSRSGYRLYLVCALI